MPAVASEPKIAPSARPLPNPAVRPGNLDNKGHSAPFAALLDGAPPAPSERPAERPQAQPARRTAASSTRRNHPADAKTPTKTEDGKPVTGKTVKDSNSVKDAKDQDASAKSTDGSGDAKSIDATKPADKPVDEVNVNAGDPAPIIQSADAAAIAPPLVPAPDAVTAKPEQPAAENTAENLSAAATLSAAGETPKDLPLKDLQPKDLAPKDLAPKDLALKDLPLKDLQPKDLAPKDLALKDLPPKDLTPKDLAVLRAAGATKDAANPGAPAPATTSAAAPVHGDGKPPIDPDSKGKDTSSQPHGEQVDAAAKVDRHAARAEPASDSAAPQVNAPGAAANTAAKSGIDAVQPLGFTAPAGQAAAPATQVAAAAAPAAPPAAVPIEGLAVEIAAKAQAGKNRFDIRLDPPELGRIDVRLDVDRDGRVTSRLVVERAETLDLLRRDAPQLERALQDAGLKTTDNGLQFSLRQQSEGRDQGLGTAADRPPDKSTDLARLIVTDDFSSPDATHRGYSRLAALRGGIDIRV